MNDVVVYFYAMRTKKGQIPRLHCLPSIEQDARVVLEHVQ